MQLPEPRDARQQEAADAHAAHVGGEEHAERDRRRTDDELEELEPDNLVDQRRNAAADEEREEGWEKAVAGGGIDHQMAADCF